MIFFRVREAIPVFLVVAFHIRLRHHDQAADFAVDDPHQGQLFADVSGGVRVGAVERLALLFHFLECLRDFLIGHIHALILCGLELQSAFDHLRHRDRFSGFEAAFEILAVVQLAKPFLVWKQVAFHFGQHDQI